MVVDQSAPCACGAARHIQAGVSDAVVGLAQTLTRGWVIFDKIEKKNDFLP